MSVLFYGIYHQDVNSAVWFMRSKMNVPSASSLDIKYQLQLLATVKSLGIGVLAALHDLSLAAMYCTKLYVLKDGEIVVSGPPNKILTPELVRTVYEIGCDIRENPDNGYLTITYYPEPGQYI